MAETKTPALYPGETPEETPEKMEEEKKQGEDSVELPKLKRVKKTGPDDGEIIEEDRRIPKTTPVEEDRDTKEIMVDEQPKEPKKARAWDGDSNYTDSDDFFTDDDDDNNDDFYLFDDFASFVFPKEDSTDNNGTQRNIEPELTKNSSTAFTPVDIGDLHTQNFSLMTNELPELQKMSKEPMYSLMSNSIVSFPKKATEFKKAPDVVSIQLVVFTRTSTR